MPVSVLSVVSDAEVTAAYSKIAICGIDFLTLLTIPNITIMLLPANIALLVSQISAYTLLTFLCPGVL